MCVCLSLHVFVFLSVCVCVTLSILDLRPRQCAPDEQTENKSNRRRENRYICYSFVPYKQIIKAEKMPRNLSNWSMLLCALAIVATVGPMPTHGAVANSHKHEKHNSKERVKDGIFVPRDAHHHGDQGEHNVEFDHEAIIGG